MLDRALLLGPGLGWSGVVSKAARLGDEITGQRRRRHLMCWC